MDFAFYFIFFCLVWWIVFFAILPIGIISTKQVRLGHDSGAPSNPRILYKFFVTTIVATSITVLIYFISNYYNININSLKDF